MTADRIYVVTNEEDEGDEGRLIQATSAAQAIRHATQPYKARVASQGDLVRLLGGGAEVEKTS